MNGHEEIQLSNGIPVVFQNYDGAVAATYWWVRTGSADESPSEAGYAHFLEHMLFKDAAAKETGRASTGQMARAIESLGGDINAYTSFDQTVYHVTCAAHQWERVIDQFGTMAKPQRFLKTDFEREREVILEELKKNEDSPGRQLFQKLFSITFKKHPYGRPVIGFVRSLKAANATKVESYYKRRYVPGRMGLVLVGPLADSKGTRKKQILKILEKRFGRGALPVRPVSEHVRPEEPAFRPEPSLATLPFDVSTPSVCFSFRVPGLMHPDTPYLDLLSGILGMGELARLYQRLFYETKLATEASAGLYVPADPGMLYAQAELASLDHVEKASGTLIEELGRVAREGPEPEELVRVVTNAESEKLYATQTADGTASRLGFLRFVLGDMTFDRKYLDQLRSADPQRVRETARRYLDPRRMNAVLMLPKGKKLDFGFVKELVHKELRHPQEKPVVKTPARKQVGLADFPTEVFDTPSGIRVAFLPRRQSHVFSVFATAPGGLRMERVEDWGVSHLMALTWAKGTGKHDARAIASIVEGHASSIEGVSGRNTSGLQLTGLARDWKTLSGLFTEVMVDPTFPEDEIEHSKRVVEDGIKGIDDHSAQLCSKLFLETLFEKHPYGKFSTGSLESLAALNREKLRTYHHAWIRPDRLSIGISGAVSRAQVDDWLGELSERFGRQTGKLSDPRLAEDSDLKAPRWVGRRLGREQLHLIVGGFGTHNASSDRHTLRLLNSLLAGQSGRLFVELREKKSLAYSVAPMSYEGVERGYVAIYIGCSPQKRQEAVDGIRAVLENLASKGPTAAEVERAREFHLGRRAMDLQSDSSLASLLAIDLAYGLPRTTETELNALFRKIGPRELKEVCRRYLVEPFQVTSAVG